MNNSMLSRVDLAVITLIMPIAGIVAGISIMAFIDLTWGTYGIAGIGLWSAISVALAVALYSRYGGADK